MAAVRVLTTRFRPGAWPGRRQLVEERHRKIAQIEQTRIDAVALFQRLQIHRAGFSEKRPSRVLPMITEMTVMLFVLAGLSPAIEGHRR